MAMERSDSVPMATLQGPHIEENPFAHRDSDSNCDQSQAGQNQAHYELPEHEVTPSVSHDRPRSFLKGDYTPFADQPREPIVVPYRGALYHLKAWSPEATWCLLTVGVFIGLVVLLAQHDGKKIPEWPLGLTLNTVVALLATMCRFMTFIPVTEGISQLKWNWFTSNTRPVKDLYAFDQASRGPWGSILLISRLRGRFISLGTMASFVMISGLATSFLTQSAIAYSTKLVADSHGGVLARSARNYPYGMIDAGYDQQDVIDGMSRAAFQAAFYTTDQSWPQLEPTCPSAHCTWPLFNTLAICTSLGNVTGHLKIEEIDAKSSMEDRRYNVSLPLNLGNLNEEWMGGVPRRHVNMTSPAIPPAQYTETPVSSSEDSLEEFPLTRAPFPDKRNTLHDWGNDDILLSTFSQYTFIYNVDNTDPDDKDHRFRAVEVLWHFCVDTYNVTVTDGITSTEKVGNSVKIDEISVNSDGLNSFTLAARVDDGSKETFNISASWAYSRLDWDFRDVLGGAWSDMYGIGQYTEFNYQLGRNLYRGVNDNMTVVEADERMWNNLQNLTGTIANGMTTYMQSTEANGHIKGQFLTPETFVTVRWAWLAFLATQIGLTYVFLLVVIVNTAKLDVQIVKSSNIAELFAISGSGTEGNSISASTYSPRWMGFQPRVDGTLNGKLKKDGENGWNLDVRHEQPRNSRPEPEG